MPFPLPLPLKITTVLGLTKLNSFSFWFIKKGGSEYLFRVNSFYAGNRYGPLISTGVKFLLREDTKNTCNVESE